MGSRREWIGWLLIVGIVALVGLTIDAKGIMAIAYPIGGGVLVLALVLLRRQRLDEERAAQVLLGVAVLLFPLGMWSLVQRDPAPVEVNFYVFRAVVLSSGVAFLALGARLGTWTSGAMVAIGAAFMVGLGVPPVGPDDLTPGALRAVALLVAVVVMFRVLTVRVARLEESQTAALDSAELAYRDELTGLPNRRMLSVHLSAAVDRAGEDGQDDALMMFDLDRFKAVNDTHGHEVGDEVLRRTAAIAAAAVRDHDLLGRWGGEEFVALLRHADIEQARRVAERCREALAAAGDEPAAVTASFGVTPIQPGDQPADVLRRADTALYDAKQAGRDRVVVRDGTTPEPGHGLRSWMGAAAADPRPRGHDEPGAGPGWKGAGRPR